MNDNFAKNLKKIRKDHNLSQEQLAEELGVSRQAISKWESSVAYPEMDKIITICKKYDVNIDDLLHRDITDAKNEKETVAKYNKLVNDVLNNITNSVDMFIRMSFTNKVKCVLENLFLIFIFAIGYVVLQGITKSIFHEVFSILPSKLYYFVTGILLSVIFIAYIALVILIMIRVFKTRYLDYYLKLKEDKNDKVEYEVKEDKIVDIKEEKISNIKNDKIVIRDPKNSDYSVAKIFVDLFFIGLRLFAAFILMGVLGTLVFGAFCTFLAIYHISVHSIFASLTFLGIFGIMLCVIVSIVLFGFIFKKKNNLKLLFILFLVGVIGASISTASVFITSTKFEMVDVNTKVNTTTIKYNDDLLYSPNRVVDGNSVLFVIDNSVGKDNIIVETSYSTDNNVEVTINNNYISTNFVNNRENISQMYNYLLPYIKENKIPRETLFGNAVTIKGTEANIKKIITNSTKDMVASVVAKPEGYTVDFSRHHFEQVVCSKKDFYYSCVGILVDDVYSEKEVKKTTFEYDGKELKYKNDDLLCAKNENEHFENSYVCILKD